MANSKYYFQDTQNSKEVDKDFLDLLHQVHGNWHNVGYKILLPDNIWVYKR